MVKADYKRDYYADLELPSTADPEAIKKKFRELGMHNMMNVPSERVAANGGQQNNTIPIATPAEKSMWSPNSKRFKPLMKS